LVSASAPETRDATEQRQRHHRHHAAADAQVQWDVLNSLSWSIFGCRAVVSFQLPSTP
jgi:hypothetical protein